MTEKSLKAKREKLTSHIKEKLKVERRKIEGKNKFGIQYIYMEIS
jgi:hypothetical protein